MLAPGDTADLPLLYEPAEPLVFSRAQLSHLKTKGDQAGSVRAPQLCSSLLWDLRLAEEDIYFVSSQNLSF